MTNKLYFVPEDWYTGPNCQKRNAKITQIKDYSDYPVLGYELGNWLWDKTEIMTVSDELLKTSDYTFTFWMYGGENDRLDEVCELHIIRDGNYNKCEKYKLNRNHTVPVKRVNGWKLFEITFSTAKAEEIELRFVVMGAETKIIPAGDASDYLSLPDDPEPISAPTKKRTIIKSKLLKIAAAVVTVLAVSAVIFSLIKQIRSRRHINF